MVLLRQVVKMQLVVCGRGLGARRWGTIPRGAPLPETLKMEIVNMLYHMCVGGY